MNAGRKFTSCGCAVVVPVRNSLQSDAPATRKWCIFRFGTLANPKSRLEGLRRFFRGTLTHELSSICCRSVKRFLHDSGDRAEFASSGFRNARAAAFVEGSGRAGIRGRHRRYHAMPARCAAGVIEVACLRNQSSLLQPSAKEVQRPAHGAYQRQRCESRFRTAAARLRSRRRRGFFSRPRVHV